MVSTDFAALNERRKQLADKLHAAGIFMTYGAPLDDEIDMIEQALEDTAPMEPPLRRTRLGSVITRVFEADFGRKVRAVNDVLLPLGRCISPAYMPNGVFMALLHRCETIATAVATGGHPASDVDWVVQEIARVYFAPHIRAFMVVRAQRLPFLSLVSHYLDDAAIAFYRRNYFACANALTTAIERLLLEHVGWKFGNPDMRHRDIRAAVADLTPRSGNSQMDARFETYKTYVLQFLQTYQTPSKHANLSVSRFNRAFIQHVNDDRSYYTYDDCVTAFQFFDLYVEFVAAQLGQEMYVFVPEDNADMNLRTKHYTRMIIEDWLHGDAPSTERAILESNPRFQKETGDSNFLSLQARHPNHSAMLAVMLNSLGVRKLDDIVAFVREPPDSNRLELLQRVIAPLPALMSLLDSGKTVTRKPSVAEPEA